MFTKQLIVIDQEQIKVGQIYKRKIANGFIYLVVTDVKSDKVTFSRLDKLIETYTFKADFLATHANLFQKCHIESAEFTQKESTCDRLKAFSEQSKKEAPKSAPKKDIKEKEISDTRKELKDFLERMITESQENILFL